MAGGVLGRESVESCDGGAVRRRWVGVQDDLVPRLHPAGVPFDDLSVGQVPASGRLPALVGVGCGDFVSSVGVCHHGTIVVPTIRSSPSGTGAVFWVEGWGGGFGRAGIFAAGGEDLVEVIGTHVRFIRRLAFSAVGRWHVFDLAAVLDVDKGKGQLAAIANFVNGCDAVGVAEWWCVAVGAEVTPPLVVVRGWDHILAVDEDRSCCEQQRVQSSSLSESHGCGSRHL